MKFSSSLGVAILSSIISVSAFAADKSYLQASISRFMPETSSGGYGASTTQVDLVDVKLDDTESISIAYGLQMSDAWRTELALDYQFPTASQSAASAFAAGDSAVFQLDVEHQSSQLMFNNYLDLAPAGATWSPYVGLGLGYTRNDVDTLFLSFPAGGAGSVKGETNNAFAWQLSFGSGYQINDDTTLDLRLTYKDLDELET